MSISIKVNRPLAVEEFIDILNRSTLGERRPVDDYATMRGMVENTNLLVTAWDGELLVGVARSMTDFHYACYLSDLAVAADYQRRGIGQDLLRVTSEQLGENCKLILVSAPAADSYYPQHGFIRNERTWVLPHRAGQSE